jgi:small-conductance mechanosensitive channel
MTALAGLPHISVLGQPLAAWVEAGAIFLVTLLAILLGRRLLLVRGARRASRTPRPPGPPDGPDLPGRPETSGERDDSLIRLVRKTRWKLLVFPALYLASSPLVLPAAGERALKTAAILALLLQVAIWSSAGIDAWVASYRRRRRLTDAASATTLGALHFLAKLVLWVLLLLLALDNLGVNVTALVTGLGIGGIAVALALQNILGDAFASLSIVLDKPFVLGDTIGVGDSTGKVLSIGLKTTRLRSATGEQLVFGNADLLKGKIRNLTRMEARNVTLAFSLAYDTPADELEAVPGLVRAIVEKLPDVHDLRFDRAHFKGFGVGNGGSAGYDFEVAYAVLTADYGIYMDRQQAIGLALVRALAERGIALARPDRLLVVEPERPR